MYKINNNESEKPFLPQTFFYLFNVFRLFFNVRNSETVDRFPLPLKWIESFLCTNLGVPVFLKLQVLEKETLTIKSPIKFGEKIREEECWYEKKIKETMIITPVVAILHEPLLYFI